MARKKVTDDAEKTSAAISQKKLLTLIKGGRAAYKNMREIAGTFGEQVKEAIEHDHLHRKAFAMVRSLDRLEPEKLAETMEQFLFYYEISGLAERAKSAPKLTLVHDADAEAQQAAE